MNRLYAQFLLDNPDEEDLSTQSSAMDIAYDSALSQELFAQSWQSAEVPIERACAHHTHSLSHMTSTMPESSSKPPSSGAELTVSRIRTDAAKIADDKRPAIRRTATHPLTIRETPLRRGLQRRTPHRLVERRYRETLNSQFDVLRLKLPLLADPDDTTTTVDNEALDEEGNPYQIPNKAPTKGTIMTSAAGYIDELEADKTALNARLASLTSQVDGLQKLVHCEDCAVMRYFSELQEQ